MAGHSKWANTKHRKARNDALRQKLWEKLLKEVCVAAKLGGEDPNLNPRLRAAIAKSKSNSVPNKNIDSAILKGVGSGEIENSEECIYEGYGVEGTAFIVETMTDNKTRTVADVRNVFNKNSGNMGELGSVSWNFSKRGQISIAAARVNEEEFFEAILEAGADDLQLQEDVYEIITSPLDFGKVMTFVEEKEYEILNAEVGYVAETQVEVSPEGALVLRKMIEKFELIDDVQEIYHNIDSLSLYRDAE